MNTNEECLISCTIDFEFTSAYLPLHTYIIIISHKHIHKDISILLTPIHIEVFRKIKSILLTMLRPGGFGPYNLFIIIYVGRGFLSACVFIYVYFLAYVPTSIFLLYMAIIQYIYNYIFFHYM
jgi:hypothetical protein